jgi:hypothetical protein
MFESNVNNVRGIEDEQKGAKYRTLRDAKKDTEVPRSVRTKAHRV